MVDLTTTLVGIPLKHPVVLASGPLSHDGMAIRRAHLAGAAAVVTKTISRCPARNPVPHLNIVSQGVLNSELWSDIGPDRWAQREIPLAKESGAVVVASIGPSVEDVRQLARPIARAGADVLELVSYDPDELPRMVSEAGDRADLPVLAKMGALWPELGRIASECRWKGAHGITAVDSLGPALRVDVLRRMPLLGGPSCWISGPALLPIALKAVAVVYEETGGPVIGTGGVSSGRDALEMTMVGAEAVGVCSLPLTRGIAALSRLGDQLRAELEMAGYASFTSAMGAAVPGLRREQRAPQPTLEWMGDRCTECGRCVELCPYTARTEPGIHDAERCRMCGLCASACPTGALVLKEGCP